MSCCKDSIRAAIAIILETHYVIPKDDIDETLDILNYTIKNLEESS